MRTLPFLLNVLDPHLDIIQSAIMRNVPNNMFFRSSGAAGLVMSLLVAFAFCFYMLPAGFVPGTSSFWEVQNEDITQYVSGFRAYVQSDWHLPLLAIPSLDWPNGTIVTFVDGIPVYALLAKALYSFFDIGSHPYGVWVVICVFFLAVGAWSLIGQIRPDSWPALVLAVILSVGMASFWARVGHLSLLSHFLIVFALAMYFGDRNSGKVRWGPWAVLLFVAFYINFYNFLMASAIYAASILDSRRPWSLYILVIPFFVIAASFPLLIGWPFSRVTPDTGFGVYSMNLLAPLYGGSIITLPEFEYATPDQGEGFNYLGLGVLATLFVLVVTGEVRRRWFRFSWLLALCVAFVIYALSNRVFFGPVEILRIELPDAVMRLTETFRASGRFFWPVSYLAVMVVAAKVSELGPVRSMVIAALILSVQLYDLRVHLNSVRGYLSREAVTILQPREWVERLDGIETLYHYPKFKCGDDPHGITLPVQSVATKAGVNLTTGYISRYGAACQAEAQEIAASNSSNSAYSFDASRYDLRQITDWLPEGVSCRLAEPLIFCRRSSANVEQ